MLTTTLVKVSKRLIPKFDHPSPCCFLKNVLSRETVKPCFFATFIIIISHIFSENFIEIHQVVQHITNDVSIFLFLTYSK